MGWLFLGLLFIIICELGAAKDWPAALAAFSWFFKAAIHKSLKSIEFLFQKLQKHWVVGFFHVWISKLF
jgi:hypothetical protein